MTSNEWRICLFHNKTYKVGSRVFKICNVEHDQVLDSNPDVRSYIDHVSSTIVIRYESGMSQDCYDELLLHELLHAVVKNAGLDQCLKDGFTEEFLVSALAPRIHDLISNNFVTLTS